MGGGRGAGKRCKPSSHGHLTRNYTQPRKQRVCFFKKARRAGFFYGPIAFFLRIFDEFFSGFRANFQKIVTCVAFSIKFAKTNQKFAENSEFCEKNSLLLVNYSLHSLVPKRRRLKKRPTPSQSEASCDLVNRCCSKRDRSEILSANVSGVREKFSVPSFF